MDSDPKDLITRWQGSPEGQFLERKGAWHYSGDRPRKRKATEIAKDVAEALSAMANADGGEVVLGLEDDGRLTGVELPEDRLAVVLLAPQTHCRPPIGARTTEYTVSGKRLLCFAVDWSPEVHDLTDGRTLLRVGDRNVPFSQSDVMALKRTKQQGLFERQFPPGATIDDVDVDLVRSMRERLRGGPTADAVLADYRLLADRGGRLAPNLACLLLFGRDPLRWHPRGGLDFVRYEGKARETGARLNVVGRERVEAPLATLIEVACNIVRPHVRERQRLHDLFFAERFEYPTFAWQEAIVNAVAHRDYSLQGTATEIHMFGDRLEVYSPGVPPEPVTVTALRSGERVHASRNPLIVRVLTELGYMQELGEGIPRMFEEMQRGGLHPPELDIIGGGTFLVRLRNEPIYDADTLVWLRRFEQDDLTGDQIRLLAYARAHGGTFTSRAYQKMTGKDIYEASKDIKDLIRKGRARSQRKGGRVYELVSGEQRPEPPQDLAAILPILEGKGFVTNSDVREALGMGRREALRRLKAWVEQGWLRQEGTRRGTRYELGARLRSGELQI